MQSPRRVPAAVPAQRPGILLAAASWGRHAVELKPTLPTSVAVLYCWDPRTGSLPGGQEPRPLQSWESGWWPVACRHQCLGPAWVLVVARWAAPRPDVWALPVAPVHPHLHLPEPQFSLTCIVGYAWFASGRGRGGPRGPCSSLPGARVTGQARTSQQGGRWWLCRPGLPFQRQRACNWIHQHTNL